MHGLSAAELLAVWEQGRTAAPVERALRLLAAAEPEASAEALAALSIGRRNERLLRLRERTFGGSLEAVTACPACGERLELAFTVADLVREAEETSDAVGPLWLEAQGWRVRFRLPSSADLAAVAGTGAAASTALLERCIEELEEAAEAGAGASLPPAIAAAVAERMAAVDPVADPELALSCPACDERWSSPFDVLAYFWAEIDAWARRTLREVHLLASAYGWTEAAILALSPQRRQAYIELVAR
jgi:hypothetical protein